MDKYRIDSHKLIYHVGRVNQWLEGKDISPLYMEISLTGACNNRCIFCAFDYLNYKPQYLSEKVLKKFISEVSRSGLKSILFSGEGEPLLHPGLVSIIRHAREKLLDVALTTNGTLLSGKIASSILPYLSWLRISFNAATANNYARIHGNTKESFYKIVANIKNAVSVKRKHQYSCVIGVQFLLIKENNKEVLKMAKLVKGLGADYLVVKPYSQHPKSINRLSKTISYNKMRELEDKLDTFSDDRFKVIFRANTMAKLNQERNYKKCLALPFWAHLVSNGDLYACSAFISDKRFCYGNIYKGSFEQIWKSAQRRKLEKLMKNSWDMHNCRLCCRMDEVNNYLWELKNPPIHVNFI
ncbi:MAG: radical SAM protein [Candidatus Omnitrophica bacterium]|jgi:radical SAM protein with 4Fe4S-binding SPASM domain|nr:radical SAM protein [Candidatus Omnitrophota bacterium]